MNPVKLKITLNSAPHAITRTILVHEDERMDDLHQIMQVAMGWADIHLYRFSDAQTEETFCVVADKEDVLNTKEHYMADAAYLDEIFMQKNGAKPFWYLYDFGDDWFHEIEFMPTTAADKKQFKGKALCLEAAGACPPENCMGVFGYAELLETLKNTKDPDYNETIQWLGLESGAAFSIEAPALAVINEKLQDLYKKIED